MRRIPEVSAAATKKAVRRGCVVTAEFTNAELRDAAMAFHVHLHISGRRLARLIECDPKHLASPESMGTLPEDVARRLEGWAYGLRKASRFTRKCIRSVAARRGREGLRALRGALDDACGTVYPCRSGRRRGRGARTHQ